MQIWLLIVVLLRFSTGAIVHRLTSVLLAVVVGPTIVFAQLPDDNSVYNSYLTDPDDAPVVDGIISPGEWDGAGPPIIVGLETRPWFNPGNLPADPHGGDEDFSYQFRTMWSAPWDIYFLVEVTDDIAMDDAHNPPEKIWQRDSVEFFVDGNQVEGGNIKFWEATDEGPQQIYGKFGISRNPCGEDDPIKACFDGNVNRMHVDPEEVGMNGVSASGIAAETGEAGNFFVEFRVSMLEAFNDGLFDGTVAGLVETMIPDETSIKLQVTVVDNDNFGSPDRWHTASVAYSISELPDGSTDWWRSDRYPNLVMSDYYEPEVVLTCDFDESGVCDAGDLDELMYSGIASGDSKYDLNGSGTVDLDDRDALLRELSSLPGDANSDGIVNAQDLNAVGSNWQQTGITSYANGDFNGDGATDAADLNVVGIYWTKTDADFAGQAAATAAVPEPNAATLGFFAVTFSLFLRARKSAS